IGYDHGQRRLPRSRWAIKNQRRALVGFDGPAQQAPWCEDMVLTDKLEQRAQPHARCQRLGRRRGRHQGVLDEAVLYPAVDRPGYMRQEGKWAIVKILRTV